MDDGMRVNYSERGANLWVCRSERPMTPTIAAP